MSKHIFTNRSKLPKKKPSKSHLRVPKKKKRITKRKTAVPSNNVGAFSVETSTTADGNKGYDLTTFKVESKPQERPKYVYDELEAMTMKQLWPIAKREKAETKKSMRKDALIKAIIKASRLKVKTQDKPDRLR